MSSAAASSPSVELFDHDGGGGVDLSGGLASAEDLAALKEAARDGLSPQDFHSSVTSLAREIARLQTGHAVSRMISESGLSMVEIAERYGFQPATLSRWANGVPKSGAELTSVIALAEALGFSLKLSVEKK
ncbi:helix-turn-helix domain-containing protein [Phycobacter azelaicus]|uniref:helix-turn-helix domain-containing protein n=1 Tax=Phycobacter azelaicus TaxID=2668075 RepID=UPI001868DF2C|nr:helix-turn-helix transcriptional regulator [Phycobacter azelaicus]